MADREALRQALTACAGGGRFRDHAAALLGALGYRSERTEEVGSVADFMQWLDEGRSLTAKEHQALKPWRQADIVFQFSDSEIAAQPGPPADRFDRGRAKSFLFMSGDLEPPAPQRPYSRTDLASMTRVLNRRLKMPVILLFRHGQTLTLAAVHRRAHKRDPEREVLAKVTLIKDIRLKDPHRAHVEILADLALSRMLDQGVRSFDDLHREWEKTLDIEALNQRFYGHLFEWFTRAVQECSFPDDGEGEGSGERHVIRLITRLLFIWFLKEKGLVPEELFREDFVGTVLKRHAPERTDYYRAVLQNLFFATLNTEIDKRKFSSGGKETPRSRGNKTHRDFTKYRYNDLLHDPAGFVDQLKQVPFVNGGLLDCLDDFESASKGGKRIDAFTDSAHQGRELDVPARLFFDSRRGLFPLFDRYKFTVEENTPLDKEVALDPELLGRVFESLLAAYNPETRDTARKATGSYYTPRPVVDYMVRQSLTEALAVKVRPTETKEAHWRDQLGYLLDWEDEHADAGEFFGDDERRAVVEAIADLKTLDPAVGSGAFPVGVLQTLTLALRRLDPDNTLWEEVQKARARKLAGESFETPEQAPRDETLMEISATFQKYRESDFGRKLYLIQHAIYGVDIQPIACQIAKLRFFISLVIEQEPDADAPNLGIKPLPNLETRFVAADTLTRLRPTTGALIFDDAVEAKRKDLVAQRERYFLVNSRPAKLACIKEEKRLREELQAILNRDHERWMVRERRDIDRKAAQLSASVARETCREDELGKLAKRQRVRDAILADANRIADWNPFNQNQRVNWFDSGWMFGVFDGFDVVIGNPPYIQLQKDGGSAGKRYRDAGYETFQRTGDIYQLFYERGCTLLKKGAGVLVYITSNSWLKAEYGKPLRRWFAEKHTPLALIEMGKDVFDEAIVDAAVLLVREGGRSAGFPAVDLDRLSDRTFPPADRQWVEARPDGEAPWSILSDVEWGVLDKMRTRGTPLHDWDVRINRGVVTGCNEAFIIDEVTKNALLAEDPRSADIIKPVLRGRDIRGWRARDDTRDRWLIATCPSLELDIDDYSAVKNHLLAFGRDRLEQNGKALADGGKARKKTSHDWFELQDQIASYDDFEKEKLFWMDLTDQGRFCYDAGGMLGTNTVYFLVGSSMKFLCAVLNSRLVTWFMENAAGTSGMGVTRWFATFVSEIPIPKASPARQLPLARLVDDILAAKDANPNADVTADEEALDLLVYDLYGLTDDEAAAVSHRSKPGAG